jgi:outer membrane phospholipase A
MPCTSVFRNGRIVPGAAGTLLPALAALLAATWPLTGESAVSVLQPPRQVDPSRPLTLTLMLSADEHEHRFVVPETIAAVATADMQAPVPLTLRRVEAGPSLLELRAGEYRAIAYRVNLPPGLRGRISLDLPELDAAPMTITLRRRPAGGSPDDQAAMAAARPGEPGPSEAAPIRVGDPTAANQTLASNSGRLSLNEPMYLLFGAHHGRNAKFQLSFKFRVYQGVDPASRGFLENLHFGYTQFSLWDLASESKPFHDTTYRPSFFYFVEDTGVRRGVLTRLGVAAGIEHESNGKDSDVSRSIDVLFVQPRMALGAPSDWHWTVAPKIYYYLDKDENPDIARYRGYVDLRVEYSKPDSWKLAATVRKGTSGGRGSVDAQLSYPLARLLPGTAGYLMADYFVGYGETLVDYNRRMPWQFRLGYALSR